MPMETSSTAMPTGIRPIQRPQERTTPGIARRGDVSSEAFAPRTNVNLKTAISDMAAVLSQVAENQADTAETLDPQLQKLLEKMMQQSFSLESTLKNGLGSTLESQRFSVDHMLTLSRVLSQLSQLTEQGVSEGLSPELETFLSAVKDYMSDSAALDPALLHKMAFEILDGKSMEKMPESLKFMLNMASMYAAYGDSMESSSPTLAFLKKLMDYFLPKQEIPSYAGKGGTLSDAQRAQGEATQGQEASSTGQDAPTEESGRAGDADKGEQTAKSNQAKTPSQTEGTARGNQKMGDAFRAAAEAEKGKSGDTGRPSSESGRTSDTSRGTEAGRQQAAEQGNAAKDAGRQTANGETRDVNQNQNRAQSNENVNRNDSNAPQQGAKAQQGSQNAQGSQVNQGNQGAQTAQNNQSAQSQQEMQNGRAAQNAQGNPAEHDAADPFGVASHEKNNGTQETQGQNQNMRQSGEGQPQDNVQTRTAQTQMPLENTRQTMETMKSMAQLLMKDATLSEQDAKLLQNFVNQNQGTMTEKDAKQLQLLLRLIQSNMPASVQQAATQQNMPDIARLWAFMELCDVAYLKEKNPAALKKASKDISEFASMMKNSMAPKGSHASENTRSMSFMMPIYMGEHEKVPYPTYIHIYDEDVDDPQNPGQRKKETWLRLCLLTENIGAVDVTFRMYEEHNVDVRVIFSNREAVEDFREYVPEFRSAFGELPLDLMDLSIGMAGVRHE